MNSLFDTETIVGKFLKGQIHPLGPLYCYLPGTYVHTQLQKVRGRVGRFFVNEGWPTAKMVAGLQILSS